MAVPNCPVHGTPMREGKGGAYFCPKKNGNEWCKEKVAAPKPEPAAAPGVPQWAAGPIVAQDVLAAAALTFAGQCLQGAVNPMDTGAQDAAIEFALRARRAMKAVES